MSGLDGTIPTAVVTIYRGDVRCRRGTAVDIRYERNRPLRSTVAYALGMAFTRIKIDHRIMGGLPCIDGTRIPVAMLVRMIAAGTPVETILQEYPQLEEDDIREALRFAAANVDQRVVPLDQSA